MSQITLSVVIPTYNRLDLLRETLGSVLAQDYWGDEIELIISNDGSKDGTTEFLNSFKNENKDKNIQVFHHEQNLGGPGNWKFCGEKARGEFIYLLSDDDLIEPHFFSTYLGVVKKNPNIDIVLSDIMYCREEDMAPLRRAEIHPESKEMTGIEALKYQQLEHHMVMSSMYRREKLLAGGNWDGQFGVHLDCGAFSRTAIRSDQVQYIHEPLFLYRVLAGSWSGFRMEKQRHNFICYRRKIDCLIEDAKAIDPNLVPFLKSLYLKHVRSTLNGLEIKLAHENISKKDLFKVIVELLRVFPEGRTDYIAIKMFVVSFLGLGWLKLLRRSLGKSDPYQGQLAVFEKSA